MPLREPSVFMFERPCQRTECVHQAMMIVEDELDDSSIATCANDVRLLVQWIRDSASGVPGPCVACGEPADDTLRIDDGDWTGRLCRGHTIAYFAHALDEPSFRKILEDAGGDPEKVHALHADFYDNGYAWQPIAVGSEKAEAYVRSMDEYPASVDPRLLDLMKAGYRELTGLHIEEGIAASMVADVIRYDQFRRDRRVEDKLAPFRDRMLEIALRLYREEDPQGLVGIHGEAGAEIYAANARDLVARLHGDRRDTDVGRMAVKLAQSFGDLTARPGDQSPEMRRLAERLVDELAKPIAKLVEDGEGPDSGRATASP